MKHRRRHGFTCLRIGRRQKTTLVRAAQTGSLTSGARRPQPPTGVSPTRAATSCHSGSAPDASSRGGCRGLDPGGHRQARGRLGGGPIRRAAHPRATRSRPARVTDPGALPRTRSCGAVKKAPGTPRQGAQARAAALATGGRRPTLRKRRPGRRRVTTAVASMPARTAGRIRGWLSVGMVSA